MMNGIHLVAHFVKLHKHDEGYASKIKQTKKENKTTSLVLLPCFLRDSLNEKHMGAKLFLRKCVFT